MEKCPICGKDFKTKRAAIEHEAGERIKANPKPIYQLFACVGLHRDSGSSDISVSLQKMETWLDDKGEQRLLCGWDGDTLLQCSRVSRKPICKWLSNKLKLGAFPSVKDAVSDFFKKKTNSSAFFDLEYCFMDWDELPRILDELNGIFPDKEWFDACHEQEKLHHAYRCNEVVDFANAIKECMVSKMDKWQELVEIQKKKADEDSWSHAWEHRDMGNRWTRQPLDYCLQDSSSTKLFVVFERSERLKHEKYAKKKNKKTYYKCDCGQKFDTVEEFDAHCSDNSVPAYFVRIYPNHFGESLPNVDLYVEYGYLTKCVVENRRMKDTTWYMNRGYYSFKNLSLDDMFGRVLFKLGDDNIVAGEFIAEEEVKGRNFDSMIVLFKDLSELPASIDKLYEKYIPFATKRMEKKEKDSLKASARFESIARKDFQKAADRVKKDSASIKKLVDGRKGFIITVEGLDKAKVEAYTRGKVDVGTKERPFKLSDETSSLVEIATSKEPKKTLEEQLGYKKTDKFLMRIDGIWCNSQKFDFHQVITGEERWKLEKKAEKSDYCLLSFGTEGSQEYDFILSDIKFQPLSEKDAEVLSRLELACRGNTNYDTIMEGFRIRKGDDDEEDAENKDEDDLDWDDYDDEESGYDGDDEGDDWD